MAVNYTISIYKSATVLLLWLNSVTLESTTLFLLRLKSVTLDFDPQLTKPSEPQCPCNAHAGMYSGQCVYWELPPGIDAI